MYLFHAASPDVALWFDRAAYALENRAGYGGATAAGPVTAFALPGGSATAGLRAIYAPNKGPYKSTGLAAMPLGDWLVTVRLSSTTLGPAQLDAKLIAIIGEIGWPRPVSTTASPAVPVAACSSPLAFPKKAKVKKPDLSQALLGSILASAAATGKAAPGPDTVQPWCREGEATAEYAAYRKQANATGYMLALGDAGRIASVFPALSLPTMPGSGGYSVTFTDVDGSVATYPSFDALPRPDQVMKLIAGGAPMARTATSGKQVNINLDSVAK